MNIKKLTQKDSQGNTTIYEFDIPPMEKIPHPGEPKGTDTVPAWLTPGEFVMNAEATRMFKPQIEAMNNQGQAVQRAQGGTIPEYKAKGGEAGPCWDGYEMVGMKQKNGKSVPNCVPIQYKNKGGMTPAAAINDETHMFLKQMEQLRNQQNQPSIMQGFIPGNEQIPQGQMVGSQGVQPVIPMDVPPIQQFEAYPVPVQAAQGAERPLLVTQDGLPLNGDGQPFTDSKLSVPTEYDPSVPAQNVPSTYIEKMTQAESGGKPEAKNPNSSAIGLHQFTDDTWVSVVNKYEPELAKGLSREELLSLRTKPAVSTRMAQYLTKENQDALAKSGLPTDDGALYLMHFAGSPRARSLLKADPSTPVSEIFPEDVIKANESVLRSKTAGEVVDWARSKMETPVGQGTLTDDELAKHMSNLNNGEGQGINIPGISSAEAGIYEPQTGTASSPGVPKYNKRTGEGYTPRYVGPSVEGGRGVPATAAPEEVPPIDGIEQVNPTIAALREQQSVNQARQAQQDIIRGTTQQTSNQERIESETQQTQEDLQKAIEGKAKAEANGLPTATWQSDIDGYQKKLEDLSKAAGVATEDSENFQQLIQEDRSKITPFNVTEGASKGGRGSEVELSENALGAAEEIVKETEKGLTQEDMNSTIQMDDDLRSGKIQNAVTQAPEGAMDKVMGFFEEYGITDLFDKKEVGMMATLYLGSRLLGYSHGGSLNFAAKNYVDRVGQKIDKHTAMVQKLATEGKYTPTSIRKFEKSKDVNDLKAVGETYKRSGDTKNILIGGKKVRVESVEDSKGNTLYFDSKGTQINLLDPRVGEYKPEMDSSTPEYQTYNEQATASAADTFDSIAKTLKDRSGDEDFVIPINSAVAARQFVSWARSLGLDPKRSEVQAMIANAYTAAINDNQSKKKGDLTATEIEPYLVRQTIIEEEGNPDIYKTYGKDGKETGYIHPVDLAELRGLVARETAEIQGRMSREVTTKTIHDWAVKKWEGLGLDEQKKYYSATKGGPSSPFANFLTEQLNQNAYDRVLNANK